MSGYLDVYLDVCYVIRHPYVVSGNLDGCAWRSLRRDGHWLRLNSGRVASPVSFKSFESLEVNSPLLYISTRIVSTLKDGRSGLVESW